MSRISEDLASSPHVPKPSLNGTDPTMHRISRVAGRMPSVAIVGAGLSGLRCADVLVRSGAKVTMFEARNRIGGRVHQVESGGFLMDLGPNWIHGTNGNPMMKLAEQTGTVVMEPEESQAVFRSDGSRTTDDEAIELSSLTWATIVDAFKYSDENSASIDAGKSLMDYFEDQLPKKVTDRQKLADLLKEAQMWGPFVGDPIERQSLKFFFLEECIDGENVFVASTYKDILKQVGKTALEKTDLHFNTEVVKFETPDGGQEAKITLTTSKGEKHTFDEVVVTCPLGWLKKNKKSAFSPPLPPRLSKAIDSIGYGRLEKLYVTFPSAWWLTSTDPSKPSYPIFTHYHVPLYHPSNPPASESWNQNVVSLAHLPAPNNHPTLLFYIYGACATSLTNSLKPYAADSQAYNDILETFSEPFYGLLPNYAPTDPACTPTAYLATTWQNDRFAGNGSYCNFQIGLEEGDQDIEVMRDSGGLGVDKGLWLAGEHTAPFVALGTTTGAWWSGEGVARRVLSKWGLEVVDDENAELGIDGAATQKVPLREAPEGVNLSGLAI